MSMSFITCMESNRFSCTKIRSRVVRASRVYSGTRHSQSRPESRHCRRTTQDVLNNISERALAPIEEAPAASSEQNHNPTCPRELDTESTCMTTSKCRSVRKLWCYLVTTLKLIRQGAAAIAVCASHVVEWFQ